MDPLDVSRTTERLIRTAITYVMDSIAVDDMEVVRDLVSIEDLVPVAVEKFKQMVLQVGFTLLEEHLTDAELATYLDSSTAESVEELAGPATKRLNLGILAIRAIVAAFADFGVDLKFKQGWEDCGGTAGSSPRRDD